MATAEEVETRPLVEKALEAGCRVVLPRVSPEGGLLLYPVEDLSTDLEPGAFGIEEPCLDGRAPVEPEEVDCFVVPGVAFDESGRRCGRGRGFYDRLLARRSSGALTVGLAFECQMEPAVPAEKHDVALDFICTERRTIQCRRLSQEPGACPRPQAPKEEENL
jgi:5-formyltetrahydrofolate cyclo-ligase